MSAGADRPARWPRDRWISPTVLNNYRNCAYRARLQYVDKVPEPFVYNVFLRKGRIAHHALQRIAQALSRGQEPIGDDEVMQMARIRLPPQEFPSEEARMAEARDIVRWVQVGRTHIERFTDATWHVIEKTLRRQWPLVPGVAPYTLMARPDVVVSRSEATGRRVFDIVDYKTGKRRPDDMPPVIMRFVARDLLRDCVDDASAATVRFTWLWLDTGEQDKRDLSVEFCNDAWREIETDLRRLVRETEWRPTPSFLCRYCPYHETVCHEQIPVGE